MKHFKVNVFSSQNLMAITIVYFLLTYKYIDVRVILVIGQSGNNNKEYNLQVNHQSLNLTVNKWTFPSFNLPCSKDKNNYYIIHC